jgi:hypothetical protein
MLAVARAVGWSADWETLRSRPTIAGIMKVTGLSRRSCQRWTRWLEVRGLLEVIRPGTTACFSPGILRRDEPNEAREWELADPSGVETGTPSVNLVSCSGSTPRTANPQPKKLTNEGGRRESARFVRAGWLPQDVAYAAEHTPDGIPWAMDDPVRHPRAHLRWRLSRWLGPDGTPLPSRSQRQAAARVAVLAEVERRRAERNLGTAPPPEWHLARAALSARDTVPSRFPPRKA